MGRSATTAEGRQVKAFDAMGRMHMIDASASEESVPPTPSPERPPLAPHDPPDPAPQAAAWDRALRVIFMETTHGSTGMTRSRSWKSNKRGRAAIKSRNH